MRGKDRLVTLVAVEPIVLNPLLITGKALNKRELRFLECFILYIFRI